MNVLRNNPLATAVAVAGVAGAVAGSANLAAGLGVAVALAAIARVVAKYVTHPTADLKGLSDEICGVAEDMHPMDIAEFQGKLQDYVSES